MVLQRLILVLIVLFQVSCSNNDHLKIVGNLEWDRLELTAESSEPLTEILVQEGERVKVGQIILRMDPRRAQAQLDEARSTMEQARAKLAEMIRGAREEKITEVRARLRGAESELLKSEKELVRQRTLVAKKLASPEALDNARAQRDNAVANRDAIKAELKALITGTTVEELDQAKAALAQSEARIRLLEVSLERMTIRAPQDGWLDSFPFKLGERPKTGAVVAVMLAGKAPYARVYIPEPLRAKVTPKTRAKVYIDGIEKPFDGHIRMISKDPVFTPYYSLTEHDRSRLSYLAEVEINGDNDQLLLSGVPLEVIFLTDGQSLR